MTPDTPRVDGEQPLPGMPDLKDTGHPTLSPDTTGHPVPNSAPAAVPVTKQRPRFSAAEAARRCGVGRTTITRALDDGRITGAEKTDDGWRIPVESLLAAGFTPTAPPTSTSEKPSTPSGDRDHDHGHDRHHDRSAHVEDLAALRADIASLTANLDQERTRRQQAEQDAAHAHQLATDRAHHIDHLAHALRLIENKSPTSTALTRKTEPQPITHVTAPISRSRLRRWFTARR